MVHFKLKLDRTSIEQRQPSINVRSLLPSTGKMRDKRNDISKRKQWILSSENEKHTNIFPNTDNFQSCC